jgi:hypothetical protein
MPDAGSADRPVSCQFRGDPAPITVRYVIAEPVRAQSRPIARWGSGQRLGGAVQPFADLGGLGGGNLDDRAPPVGRAGVSFDEACPVKVGGHAADRGQGQAESGGEGGSCGADVRPPGARPGPEPRLAWFGDCGDYVGVLVALVLVAAGAAVWWLARHKRWGAGGKLVFWVALLVVLWVVVTRYSPPHPEG